MDCQTEDCNPNCISLESTDNTEQSHAKKTFGIALLIVALSLLALSLIFLIVTRNLCRIPVGHAKPKKHDVKKALDYSLELSSVTDSPLQMER